MYLPHACVSGFSVIVFILNFATRVVIAAAAAATGVAVQHSHFLFPPFPSPSFFFPSLTFAKYSYSTSPGKHREPSLHDTHAYSSHTLQTDHAGKVFLLLFLLQLPLFASPLADSVSREARRHVIGQPGRGSSLTGVRSSQRLRKTKHRD